MEQVSSIGFDVAVTMTDGYSSNMKLFKQKLLNDSPARTFSMPHVWELGCLIFLIFDTVDLFKIIYNNWTTKHLLVCPTFNEKEQIGVLNPNFCHLNELY